MNKDKKIRFILFIALTFLMYLFFTFSINYINKTTINPISLNDNILDGDSIDNNLYIINNINFNNDETNIKVESTKDLSIVFHNLYYPYKLIINGNELNNKNYSYNDILINKGINNIKLIGKGVRNTFLFVSTYEKMKGYLEIRLLVNSLLLFIHLIIFLGCIIVLNLTKNKKVVYIFLLYVLSSFLKGINLGEIPIFLEIFNMNIFSYNLIDGITTAINNIVPIYILLIIFEINIKKIYKVVFLLSIIPFAIISQDILLKFQIWHLFSSLLLLLITFIILLIGYINKKNAALSIMILRTLFFVLTLSYLTIIRNSTNISNLIFFCNYAYLGATIYFLAISIFVVVYYIKYNKQLAKKEIEYERVMLLKGIGHDLKHPVLCAKLNNQFLLECDLNEEEKESVELSLAALSRLDKMVENINSYFNKKDEIAICEYLFLRDVLIEIEENYKNQLNKKLKISHANSNCYIYINPLNFYRIMENIIDNAFKFNKEDVEVNIFCEIENNYVIINIQDTGMGLEKDEIEKVFDVFYRGEESKSTEGLGIGLSVVKQLVESSNGEIFVRSQKNIGTTFSIKFKIENKK